MDMTEIMRIVLLMVLLLVVLIVVLLGRDGASHAQVF
jgi:hypothetical protein